MDACYLEDVQEGFVADDGRVWTKHFKELSIIVSQRKSALRRIVEFVKIFIFHRKRAEGVKGVWSMLGFDFLKDCKISFSGDEAYLDI